ncbi:MAG: phosphoribosylaminoimidazolesuccinocarboxamide synthase [Balneolales bacterium]|nr:phosphoribosylaminoimidazolesuccinocarboxamide synthase [Balneolales bacterium]
MNSEFFSQALKMTSAPGWNQPYRGKVRDVYDLNNGKLAIVVTDRISSFDHILPEAIPFKGQVLNRIAAFSMQQVEDIISTHLIDIPHPNITIARKCTPLKVEVVVRGYLCGHALRVYRKGGRVLCGEKMPEDMKAYQPFPEPIITPTTKASEGHDEDISHEQIVSLGLVNAKLWDQICGISRKLFQRGTKIAANRNLILADTKYEFGIFEDELYLIDEIHTPDSSRYFLKDSYEKAVAKDESPTQLSKEFVREWLISEGFAGRNGDIMPDMSQSKVTEIYQKYIELYTALTGEEFTPVFTPDFDTVLGKILSKYSSGEHFS